MTRERCMFCGNTVFVEAGTAETPGWVCAGPLGCRAIFKGVLPPARKERSAPARTR